MRLFGAAVDSRQLASLLPVEHRDDSVKEFLIIIQRSKVIDGWSERKHCLHPCVAARQFQQMLTTPSLKHGYQVCHGFAQLLYVFCSARHGTARHSKANVVY